MAKKAKHEEHENHERWLVSYADFITLLFAFFVVMYSISSVNEGKFRTVSESIQAALRPVVSAPVSDAHFDLGDFKASVVPILTKKVQIVRQVQAVLKKFVEEREQGRITVATTEQGVLVTIADSMVFESGRADVRPEALPVLEALADVMSDNSVREIRVQGHTDNVPIRSGQFPSNWELSSVRAVMFVRVLTELYRVPPERISATGYGEFRPITDNLTPESRTKNRRVELMVFMHEDNRPLEESKAPPPVPDTP
ncbi:MAG: flagellar motor protein MotB [Nitrospiraceae bacterium]